LLQLALATITRQARRIQALENENARLRLELKMREQRN
jgi:cell shape-determining protein MreC